MKISHYVLLAGLLFPVCEAVQAQTVQTVAVQTAADETVADYPLNYDVNAQLPKNDRELYRISLKSGNDKEQVIEVNQGKRLYINKLQEAFCVRKGYELTPRFDWKGQWMNGYIFLDVDNDGKFDVVTRVEGSGENAQTVLAEDKDLMTYSHFKGQNSKGETLTGGATAELNPPSFRLPKDLKPGVYRLRYKVDWDNVEPGGSTVSGNDILTNRGAIVDTRLIVCSAKAKFIVGTRADGGGVNGQITDAEGQSLDQKSGNIGKPFTVCVKPNEGYVFSHLVVRHGVGVQGGDSLVHGTPQFVENLVPAYLFKDNAYTLPGKYIDGEVMLIPYFVKDEGNAGANYALNFDREATVKPADAVLNGFTVEATQGGSTKVTVPASEKNLVYRDLMTKEVSVMPGDAVAATVDYKGQNMNAYLYVDYNQDGMFNAGLNAAGLPTAVSELAAFSYYNGKNSEGKELTAEAAGCNLPAFKLPADLPAGMYRARLKVDRNNISPAGDSAIDANGGYVADFLLNVHGANGKLDVQTMNGSLVGQDLNGLPRTIGYGQKLLVRPVAALKGYKAENISIRYGHNLDGEQYVHGNRQWQEYTVPVRDYTLPANKVNGDVRLTLNYAATDRADMVMTFNDEFNQADGTQPDEQKWRRCTRYGSTWNRFLASTPEAQKATGYIEDGKFVALCIPNSFDNEKDNQGKKLDMVSGGIESYKKYDFTYGKVEGRMLTYKHTGNFPAFWMMPTNQSLGWPKDGEIDIWEQIDNEDVSYHTIHSNWANNLGQSNNPAKGGTGRPITGNYHTFGLEWTAEKLVWFVDGKQVFSYAKSKNKNDLEQGQWPFDKDFYLILNQSVGNGSWARPCDVNHTYVTLFDWVRVYQKKSDTGIDEQQSASKLDLYVSGNQVRIVAVQPELVTIYDLQGRMVYRKLVQGNENVTLNKGVYVLNGKKITIR